MIDLNVFLSALPARGATQRGVFVHAMGDISIRAPREGSDVYVAREKTTNPLFLSALPARGATVFSFALHVYGKDFYPRSPRGERLTLAFGAKCKADFYPRSPRGERPSNSIL